MKLLKEENASIQTQVGALLMQIKNLQARIDGKTKYNPRVFPHRHLYCATEASKSLGFLGFESDDLNNFRVSVSKKISDIKSEVVRIANKVEEISALIEDP